MKLKHSITGQFAAMILSLVAGTVLLCWFLNTTFLGTYYIHEKQNVMLEGYAVINAESKADGLWSEAFDIRFENICANGNISILIISADGTIVRSSVNDTDVLRRQFMDVLFSDASASSAQVLKETNRYVLERRRDTRLDAEYMMLWGTLEDGNLILMRTALESIRESAWISNRFLAYVGGLAIVVSAILSVLVSKKIANPILELTRISSKMTDLDFNAKYKSRGNNEIDLLGEHINQLSETLESTISELKSANNELQIDIEKKIQIDEMRKDFLSNVSHVLKTPLALIQGYAEVLRECIH